MKTFAKQIISPLETKAELEIGARFLLKKAGVLGVLPTPLDELLEHNKIKLHQGLPEKENFLKTLTEKGKNTFISAFQNIRGIADLREKAIYIPKDNKDIRERFALAHEIAHSNIEHHNIGFSLVDTNQELRSDVKEIFEREANYFGAELLFQGINFNKMARDYAASMEAPLMLANDHGTSKHSTIWKYVEIQDEKICVAEFYPKKNRCADSGFTFYKAIPSDSFRRKFFEFKFPELLDSGSEWAQAKAFDSPISGYQNYTCNGQTFGFEWSAWFNSYTLFVMLRHKPILHRLGAVVRNINTFK